MATSTQPAPLRWPLRLSDYYWLARCEGFRVATRDGRLGTVFGVHFEAATGTIAALRVRTGLLRTHIVEIPIDRVLRVDAQHRLIEVIGDDGTADVGPDA